MRPTSSTHSTDILPTDRLQSAIILRFVLINLVAIVLGITFVNLVRLMYPKPDTILGDISIAVSEPTSNAANQVESEHIQPEPVLDPAIEIPQANVTDLGAEQVDAGLIQSPAEVELMVGTKSLSLAPALYNIELTAAVEPDPASLVYLGGNTSSERLRSYVESITLQPENQVAIAEPPALIQTETLPPESLPSEPVPPAPAQPLVRRLKLPSIGMSAEIIDAPIVNNNWDITEVDVEVGQLEGFSAHPEDDGAIVLAAHATLEWPTSGPFNKLRNAGLGDTIIYQTGDTDYIYTITRFLRVDIANVDVLNKNGEDGIVLVTCGSYNYFTGEYGKRLVAYGKLIDVQPVVARDDFE